MADAKKIELEMDCDGLTVVQTLGLSSVPEAEGAGLITEKIELLTGDYQLMSYTIYGAVKPGKDTGRVSIRLSGRFKLPNRTRTSHRNRC